MDEKEWLLIEEMLWECNSFLLTFSSPEGLTSYNWGHCQNPEQKGMESIAFSRQAVVRMKGRCSGATKKSTYVGKHTRVAHLDKQESPEPETCQRHLRDSR